jgi:predicted DNA-binding protein with PD1-like motif
MNHTSLSRRQWIGSGLVACGYLAASGLVLAQPGDAPVPNGYTGPGPVIDRGRAPGMRARLVAENPGGEQTYAIIFGKGDEILSGLTEFAGLEQLTAGYFVAIGALQSARFGWFDPARKAYRDIPVNQQVELISLIGDVGLVNGAPQIHAHGSVGLPDGQVRGGHLLEAIVWPTLEVFFTTCPTPLIKKHDDETNLFLFDLET